MVKKVKIVVGHSDIVDKWVENNNKKVEADIANLFLEIIIQDERCKP